VEGWGIRTRRRNLGPRPGTSLTSSAEVIILGYAIIELS
jgi:hypothetical protein